MGGEFTLDESGLGPLAELHSQVANGLAQLAGGGGPQPADVARSFGNIAFAVNTALDGVTQSRCSTLQTAKGASDSIAELLGTAEKLYAQGDQEGAAKLRAAAETLERSGATGGAGVSGATGGAGAAGAGTPGGGTDMAGQMASQIGQQVGQIAQGVAQAVQGLAQGLTQLPQQIVQGLQGISGSDAKHSEAEGSSKADEKESGDREDRKRDEAEAADKRAEEDGREQQRPPVRSEGAHPGSSADAGPPPVMPPPAPPRPAQTRPQ